MKNKVSYVISVLLVTSLVVVCSTKVFAEEIWEYNDYSFVKDSNDDARAWPTIRALQAGQYCYAQFDGSLLENTLTFDWLGRLCYMNELGVAVY